MQLVNLSSSRFCLTRRHKVATLKMALFVFLAALCESHELLNLCELRAGRRRASLHSGRRAVERIGGDVPIAVGEMSQCRGIARDNV